MRLRAFYALMAVVLALGVIQPLGVSAQTPAPTATPVPLPPSNALLIYDKTTVALINISPAPLSLVGVSFMRGGGIYKFWASSMISSLAPGHCIQVWTADVRNVIGQPPECTQRDRWQRLTNKGSYFWVADWDGEPFRPQLRDSALKICKASFGPVGRCDFYLPQGDDAKKPWTVLDPDIGVPLPAGMAVAYDANQLWIANLTPDTELTVAHLQLFYTVNGKPTTWGAATLKLDADKTDGHGLKTGQCIVLYGGDPSKVTPLLPCTMVGQAVITDQPWRLQFDVMGPREERHSKCSTAKPVNGPVLCLIGG